MGISPNVLSLEVKSRADQTESCLIFTSCEMCSTDEECEDLDEDFDLNAIHKLNVTKYGSEIEYECGLGKKFEVDVGNGSTIFEPTQTMSCQWDETWSPTDTLNTCKCIINSLKSYMIYPNLKQIS